jgi:hypothetical protein
VNDREKFEYAQRVVAELVRRIDALLETPEAGGRLIMRTVNGRTDDDLDALLGQISALCEDIESPDGKRGRLGVDEDTGSVYVVTDVKITGRRGVL